jgi:hypothetical protein
MVFIVAIGTLVAKTASAVNEIVGVAAPLQAAKNKHTPNVYRIFADLVDNIFGLLLHKIMIKDGGNSCCKSYSSHSGRLPDPD